MKINSKNLWEYINEELGTYDKVKFNVYYDDNYVTQIYWNGENFEWEPGRFTSEAFFNPLYDFVVIEGEKIPEKLELPSFIEFKTMTAAERYVVTAKEYDVLNDIIDYLKSKGE